jgi:hypothetical protein
MLFKHAIKKAHEGEFSAHSINTESRMLFFHDKAKNPHDKIPAIHLKHRPVAVIVR